MVYFTSDRHFGHANIIDYCSRPFRNSREMDEALIANHNALVGVDDDVYDLGDFAFGRGVDYAYALHCFTRLNGRKHFVRGNHDKLLDEIYRKQPQLFASYERGYSEIEVNGVTIILCHYAMREWHHALKGTWHLFGHTHNSLPGYGKSFDVGVDAWEYKPVSFEQVSEEMRKRPVAKHAMFERFRDLTPLN